MEMVMANAAFALKHPESNFWNGFSGNTLQRDLSALTAFSLPPLVPLLSRILPSDACKIHKQGINIRWVLLLYPDISVPGKSWIPVGLTESLRSLGTSMTWNFRPSGSLFWAEYYLNIEQEQLDKTWSTRRATEKQGLGIYNTIANNFQYFVEQCSCPSLVKKKEKKEKKCNIISVFKVFNVTNAQTQFQESLQALPSWFSLESNVFSGIFFRGQNLKTKRQEYDLGDSIWRTFCSIQGMVWVCKVNF